LYRQSIINNKNTKTMKMKRFTLVLGVLFMGGILATSMTSCDNTVKESGTEAVAPDANDDTAEATVANETVDSVEATDDAKCGEGKCGDGKCGGDNSAKEKAVDKDEVLKGEVEAPVTDKEKELSKSDPVEEVEKSVEGAKKESAKVESKELKCGGGK
jgi:uncharacterized low-complexity protein